MLAPFCVERGGAAARLCSAACPQHRDGRPDEVDAVAIDAYAHLAAARRGLERGQFALAEPSAPVGRQAAVRRSRHGVLVDADPGRERFMLARRLDQALVAAVPTKRDSTPSACSRPTGGAAGSCASAGNDSRVRRRAAGSDFVIEPYIGFKGEVGEQATMFIADPSGNHLEFKSFKDMSRVFAR